MKTGLKRAGQVVQGVATRAAIAPNVRLEARPAALLETMTVEQQVGRLIQADIGSLTPDDVRHYPLGSILNGGNPSPGHDAFAPPSKWLALADRFYDPSADPAHDPHRSPIPRGTTGAVLGHNNIVGATIFPHNRGLDAALLPRGSGAQGRGIQLLRYSQRWHHRPRGARKLHGWRLGVLLRPTRGCLPESRL